MTAKKAATGFNARNPQVRLGYEHGKTRTIGTLFLTIPGEAESIMVRFTDPKALRQIKAAFERETKRADIIARHREWEQANPGAAAAERAAVAARYETYEAAIEDGWL